VILISNKYSGEWGELLSDTVLTTALPDRLLHHAHVLNIRGETYPLKDRRKTGVQSALPTVIPVDS
jgi:DNA replication protein DnaC